MGFEMFHVGLSNLFKAVVLYQLNDSAKPGLHVERQALELFTNEIIEKLYDPSHPALSIAFLQYRQQTSRAESWWMFVGLSLFKEPRTTDSLRPGLCASEPSAARPRDWTLEGPKRWR
jgi:hypothetical protein